MLFGVLSTFSASPLSHRGRLVLPQLVLQRVLLFVYRLHVHAATEISDIVANKLIYYYFPLGIRKFSAVA